jgi:purine-binding chemotaxis protein CheW
MTTTTESQKKAEIFRARAAALAAEPAAPENRGDQIEVIEFQLADENYAIESKWIKEVYPLKDLTPVPCTPAFIFGIINVRGQILAVIDLRRFFDLPFKGLTNLNKAIILHDGKIQFGILADAIRGTRTRSTSAMQESLPTLTGIRAQYLMGVTDDRVTVLDGRKLIASKEIVVDEKIDAAS